MPQMAKDFGMKRVTSYLNDSIRIRQRQSSYLRIKGNYISASIRNARYSLKDLGQHVANIVSLDRDETIIWATVVPNFEEEKRFIVFVTKNGMIKKTELNQYKVQRYSRAFVAVNLKKDDEVVDIFATDGTSDIVLATHGAYALIFHEDEVSPVGVRAAGVKAINLKKMTMSLLVNH